MTITKEHIKRVLMSEWDPIGVRNEPDASDEYDEYVTIIYALLKRGAEESALVSALIHAETVKMGLGSNETRAMKTAKILIRGID